MPVNEHALDSHAHEHHEHHPHEEASIFPAVCSVGTATMLLGLASYWNKFAWGLGLNMIGLAILLVGMIGWWWELVQSNKKDEVTLIGTPEEARRGLKIGFGFFIGSEVMFFAAFFAFYFYSRFHAPSWPPPGYSRLPLPPALINTALLVTSGFIYMWAEHRLQHAKGKALTVAAMASAVVLGAIFLGIQAKEWMTLMAEGLHVTDGTMGAAFYMLTGFHGFHVIVGALFLSVITVRTALNHFTPHKHFAMTAAGWYWHFVDVVWIGLVLCLYVF
jgi:cytochrome c oxidase subunit 3